MPRASTLDVLMQLVAEEIGCDDGDVSPQTRLVDLGADSLDLLELGMAIEEVFGLELSDDDLRALGRKPVSEMAKEIDVVRSGRGGERPVGRG